MAHSTILGIHDLDRPRLRPRPGDDLPPRGGAANEDVLALHDEIRHVEKELREKLGATQ